MTIAPASRRHVTTAESSVAMRSSIVLKWQVVGRPATSIMSLKPIGTP